MSSWESVCPFNVSILRDEPKLPKDKSYITLVTATGLTVATASPSLEKLYRGRWLAQHGKAAYTTTYPEDHELVEEWLNKTLA